MNTVEQLRIAVEKLLVKRDQRYDRRAELEEMINDLEFELKQAKKALDVTQLTIDNVDRELPDILVALGAALRDEDLV